MATIKSFTDLQQSKKLAEILPLESADMEYMFLKEDGSKVSNIPFVKDDEEPEWPSDSAYDFISCWSLAALLEVLPDEISMGEGYQNKYEINIRRHYGGNNITLYQIAYGNNKGLSGSWHDIISTSEQEKFVDVCYEMICWLKENNKL